MASRFFLVFLVVILTISNGTFAADTPVDNKSSADSSKKSFGPSQELPDYDIPKELAPDGVEAVPDYMSNSDAGSSIPPGQLPEDLSYLGYGPPGVAPNAASRSSSTVLSVVAVAVAGGASLFFF